MPYKDPEKAREGQRRYRQKNREKQREYQHQHRLKNKERINERARARYHQHGKEQKHLNYLKNKERAREYNQKYYLNNKEQLREKHRAYWQKYYQSLKGKTHKQEYLKEYGQRPEIKEKNRNYQRELRRSNPKVQEYHRRYMCEWRINNPLYAKLKDKVKRARLHSVYHAPYSQDEVDAQLVEQNYLDFYTDKPLFNGSIEPDITEEQSGKVVIEENVLLKEQRRMLVDGKIEEKKPNQYKLVAAKQKSEKPKRTAIKNKS